MGPWRVFAGNILVPPVSRINLDNESNWLESSLFAGMVAKKKKVGKLGPVAEKKVIPVETDPSKLVNYVCGSNYMQKGEDIKVGFSQYSLFPDTHPNHFICRSNQIPSTLTGCGPYPLVHPKS